MKYLIINSTKNTIKPFQAENNPEARTFFLKELREHKKKAPNEKIALVRVMSEYGGEL